MKSETSLGSSPLSSDSFCTTSRPCIAWISASVLFTCALIWLRLVFDLIRTLLALVRPSFIDARIVFILVSSDPSMAAASIGSSFCACVRACCPFVISFLLAEIDWLAFLFNLVYWEIIFLTCSRFIIACD